MALTNATVKEILSLAGADPERIPSAAKQIIDGNIASVEALRDRIEELEKENKSLKDTVKTSEGIKRELDDAKEKLSNMRDVEKRAEQFDKVKEEFDNYKAEQEKKAADEVKRVAFKELLSDMKISDNGIAQILKWQGVDGVEMDENGKIANAKDLRKSVKEDWGDYIVETNTYGLDTPRPPVNDGGKTGITRDEILKIKDSSERQKAIAENPSLFGLA